MQPRSAASGCIRGELAHLDARDLGEEIIQRLVRAVLRIVPASTSKPAGTAASLPVCAQLRIAAGQRGARCCNRVTSKEVGLMMRLCTAAKGLLRVTARRYGG